MTIHCNNVYMMSYVTLGWLRLENFINIKKLLFIRTLMVQKEGTIHKDVFKLRLNQFIEDPEKCIENAYNSPIFEMLKVACIYEVMNDVIKMINGTHYYSKGMWSMKIWEIAWKIEDIDWNFRTMYFNITKMYMEIETGPQYSVWWKIADTNPKIIRQCETMIKIVCGASKLKVDDHRNRSEGTMCSLCDNYAKEDIYHVTMQCKATEHLRIEMLKTLSERIGVRYCTMINSREDYFYIMMGKNCEDIPVEVMTNFWATSCIYISKMYWTVINGRKGIGWLTQQSLPKKPLIQYHTVSSGKARRG